MRQSISPARIAALKNGWRSGLEQAVGAMLEEFSNETGLVWDYESERISYTVPSRLAKYTPDFPLITLGSNKKIYVETKGRFLTADRQKHILIKAQQPLLDIRFVFSSSRTRISKQSKTTYAAWCRKHEFIFADRSIPKEWLHE
jgi:hypothetical protein